MHDTLDKVKDFSDQVRSGRLRGATGKLLTNIVAVGIGGSYLGPEFLHEVGSVDNICNTSNIILP